MTSLRPTRKPAFLWQAGLILLPVLVIAAVAITAIIQNRAEVEREARRRAEEVARQYGKELERPWGSFLMRQDRYSQRWSDYLANVVGGWPGSERRAQMEAEAAQVPALDPQAQLAEWQAQYPGLAGRGGVSRQLRADGGRAVSRWAGVQSRRRSRRPGSQAFPRRNARPGRR